MYPHKHDRTHTRTASGIKDCSRISTLDVHHVLLIHYLFNRPPNSYVVIPSLPHPTSFFPCLESHFELSLRDTWSWKVIYSRHRRPAIVTSVTACMLLQIILG
jgi:hypothetical protein